MTAPVRIRQLGTEDKLESAIHLLQRFFREEGFDTPDEVIARNTKAMVTLEVCGLFVAEADQETIGVATVSLDFGIEFGWSAEMGDLYVVPEWRGRGVSRALVEAIEVYLRAKHVQQYRVTVTPFAQEHHALKNFYAALGFESEGRIELSKPLDRSS